MTVRVKLTAGTKKGSGPQVKFETGAFNLATTSAALTDTFLPAGKFRLTEKTF